MTSNFNSQNKNEKVHVNSYTRKDGTEVDDYLRHRPNSGIVEPDKNYSDNFENIEDIKNGFKKLEIFSK